MRPGFCDGFAFRPNGDLVQIASNNNGITWMGQVVGTWFVNRNLLTLNVREQQARKFFYRYNVHKIYILHLGRYNFFY